MDDLIRRQDAIDAVQKYKCEHGYDYADCACDIEKDLKALLSAQPEQRWILVTKRLPEDLEEVNVTWVNHAPEQYYDFVKDKHFTDSAVYYKGSWYWYSSTCVDMLSEYGRNEWDKIDDDIEVIAWTPLPEPYTERRES